MRRKRSQFLITDMEEKKFYIKTSDDVPGKDAILELIRRGGNNSSNLQGNIIGRDPSIYYLDLTTDKVIRCAIYEPNSALLLNQLGFSNIKREDFLIFKKEDSLKQQPTSITINIQVPETINLINSDDCSVTTSNVSLLIKKNFKPTSGEIYYYITINANGEKAIHQTSCGMSSPVDQNCFEIGNCFKTREEAEKAKISGI